MNHLLEDSAAEASTLRKTLMTAVLIEGFWDRWIAHGIESKSAASYRSEIRNLEQWIQRLSDQADLLEDRAIHYDRDSSWKQAERHYRLAGLHHNLIQWIYPRTGEEKKKWFASCKRLNRLADGIAKEDIREAAIPLAGSLCNGRIRTPKRPAGCVIILNPIDSSKEELFSYEMDFSDRGYATVSFDGPGQGESYVIGDLRATRTRMERFVNEVIEFAAAQFPDLDLFLFGTSSGALWTIQGSRHPKVKKAVSVSPAYSSEIPAPDYFRERLSYQLEGQLSQLLPELQDFKSCCPILLVHGNRDVMVRDEDIYELYGKLPTGKRLIEYAEEGHCCNYRLGEIRAISADWFEEG